MPHIFKMSCQLSFKTLAYYFIHQYLTLNMFTVSSKYILRLCVCLNSTTLKWVKMCHVEQGFIPLPHMHYTLNFPPRQESP